MKWLINRSVRNWLLFFTAIVLPACQSSSDRKYQVPSPVSDISTSPYGATASLSDNYSPVPSSPRKSASQLYKEANVKQDLIKKGTYGRKVNRRLNPKYITIHSTQNYSAGAWQHSKALRNGKLRARKRKGGNRIGYLTWHFTVDEGVAVQHLPTNEQGEHADFDGPGNNHSLAIEMCEHRGNSRSATLERTAKLCAWLMYKHKIPLRKIVPHYHWRRKGVDPEHKNCPHFLLDNGRPGAKWQWFLAKVNKHYKSITTSGGGSYTPAQYTSNQSTPSSIKPLPSSYQLPSTITPVSSSRSYQSTTPSRRYHTVTAGDTLYSLSRRYGASVSAIQRANGLNSSNIINGKRLVIPTS